MNDQHRSFLVLAALLLGVATLAACGGKDRGPEEPPRPGSTFQAELEGAPDWVLQSCEAYYDDATDVICGVGSVAGTRNISLARSTAQARGRTEIARTLNTRVESMLRDYQATVTGGSAFGTAADDEQFIQDVSRQITDTAVPGARLVDTWVSNTGTMWVLMALDLEQFESALGRMEQLDARVREAVEQRAMEAFGDLDEALERRR